MGKVPAWGRVDKTKGQRLCISAEDRLGAICNDRKRYPRWTKPMVGALTRTREEGRKWFQLYDKIADVKTLQAAWSRIEQRTQGQARQRGAGVDGMIIAEYAANATQRQQHGNLLTMHRVAATPPAKHPVQTAKRQVRHQHPE